jgi:hypothetical protein
LSWEDLLAGRHSGADVDRAGASKRPALNGKSKLPGLYGRFLKTDGNNSEMKNCRVEARTYVLKKQIEDI